MVDDNGCSGGETYGDCFSDKVVCGSCGGKVNVGGMRLTEAMEVELMVAAEKLRLMTMNAEVILMEPVVEMRLKVAILKMRLMVVAVEVRQIVVVVNDNTVLIGNLILLD